MPELALTTIDQPTTPAQPNPRRRVTPRVIVAVKAIVWEGQELDEAARTAGLTTHALRLALQRRHVLTFMKAERDQFRAYVSAQNIHRAKQIRDQSGNAMAQLGAIKYLDSIDDEPGAVAARSRSPGVVFLVVGAAPHMPHIQHAPAKPLIEHASVPHRDSHHED